MCNLKEKVENFVIKFKMNQIKLQITQDLKYMKYVKI